MLLELADWLARHVSALPSVPVPHVPRDPGGADRAGVLAAGRAAMIRKLAALKVGQVVRSDGPQTHLPKAGTPTMGGALILVAVAASRRCCGRDLRNRYVWIVLGVTLAFGADRLLRRLPEARRRQLAAACRALEIFLAVGRSASARGLFAVLHRRRRRRRPTLYLPFFKHGRCCRSARVGFIALAYFMIVGLSNAVNLTDGLDGLAIMPACWSPARSACSPTLAGNAVFSEYLAIPAIPAPASW